MRLEDQNCKCECSKIVAEMFSGRQNSSHRLKSKPDSLLSSELCYSRPTLSDRRPTVKELQSITRPSEDSKKHSVRKCSIVDDQLKICKPKALSRTDSQHRRTSKSTASGRSTRPTLGATSSRKSIIFSDDNTMKLSQDTKKLKFKKRKRGLNGKQVIKYSKGLYPGLIIGHVKCVDSPVFVPKNMGWLWNINDEVTGRKPHPDWMPGAVPKYLKTMIKRIQLELDGKNIENLLASTLSKRKLSKYKTTTSDGHKSREEFDTEPTLHLHTKKGVYYIKVLPDEGDDYRKKPMVFTIGEDDTERVSSDSSLEIELIRPDMNTKYDKMKESLQESVVEQELTEEIKIPKSDVTKKKKHVLKKNNAKL